MEKWRTVSDKGTDISIDFSGEELVQIGLACIAEKLTFTEFIDKAIRDLVEKIQKEKTNENPS
jgi:hypothetical protein